MHLTARHRPDYGSPAPGYGSTHWKDSLGLPDIPSLQAADELQTAYLTNADRCRQAPLTPESARYASFEESWQVPTPAVDEVTLQLRRTAAHLLQSPEIDCRRAYQQLQPPAPQRRIAQPQLLTSSMLLAETLGASPARLSGPSAPLRSHCAELGYGPASRRTQQPMHSRFAGPAYAQHLHPSFPDRGQRAAESDLSLDFLRQPQQSETFSRLQPEIPAGCISHGAPDLYPIDSLHATEEADFLQVPTLVRHPQLPHSGHSLEALRHAQLYHELSSPTTLLTSTPLHQHQRHSARQQALHDGAHLLGCSQSNSGRFSFGSADGPFGQVYTASDAKARQYISMLEAGSSSEGSPAAIMGTPQLPVGTYATPSIPTPLSADIVPPETPISVVPVLEISPSNSPAETTAAADDTPDMQCCPSAEEALLDMGLGSAQDEEASLLRSSEGCPGMPPIPGPNMQANTARSPANAELPPVSLPKPPSRQREQVLKRYSEKKRRRLHAKTIRYHKRKVNADNRPRIKGRFVKASEAALLGIPIPPQQQLNVPQQAQHQQQELSVATVQHAATVPDCLRQHSEDPDAAALGGSLLDASFDFAGRFLAPSGLMHSGMLAECDSLDLDISHHER